MADVHHHLLAFQQGWQTKAVHHAEAEVQTAPTTSSGTQTQAQPQPQATEQLLQRPEEAEPPRPAAAGGGWGHQTAGQKCLDDSSTSTLQFLTVQVISSSICITHSYTYTQQLKADVTQIEIKAHKYTDRDKNRYADRDKRNHATNTPK